MRILISGAAGKLGSVLVSLMVSKGHAVYVYDTNIDNLRQLLSGKQIHHDASPLFSNCKGCWNGQKVDVELIVVPTPSNREGVFDCVAVHERITAKPACKKIVVSTVNPGFTPQGVIYGPTLIALGEINFEEYIFCGCDTQADRDLFLQVWQKKPGSVYFVSRVEAELIKIGINSYLTSKISFANALGQLAETYGADPAVVCLGVSKDKRIGTTFFKPGLTFAGPCLPRDSNAMLEYARQGGVLNMQEMMITNNRVNATTVIDYVSKFDEAQARMGTRFKSVGIVGMAYKAYVPYHWDSLGVHLSQHFAHVRSIPTYTYCPWCPQYKDTRAFDADYVYYLHGTSLESKGAS